MKIGPVLRSKWVGLYRKLREFVSAESGGGLADASDAVLSLVRVVVGVAQRLAAAEGNRGDYDPASNRERNWN
jgi:hypothetical protein